MNDKFVPVEVSGTQYVDVGVLKYISGKYPAKKGYYLCRLETSFGGPYYKVLYYDNEKPVPYYGNTNTFWTDGSTPFLEITHWAPLPKICLDAVVPAPQEDVSIDD
jgi:hypothetical protein